MQKSILIKNLSHQYIGTDIKAIDNLTLEVETGEIFALLGPNGAGKTTLISILTGLIKPQAGEVMIEGHDLVRETDKIQALIGVVPQEYAIYPKLTAKENLQFFGSMYGVRKKELDQRIEEGLRKMNLFEFANRKIETFSGGMKRRINLLAGLLHQPKLLFLDEPTVGVDVRSKRMIIDFLTELNQDGVTIIYTSHLLQEAQDFCSRVAVMDQGIIQVEGKTEEVLMRDGKMRSLEEIFLENTNRNV